MGAIINANIFGELAVLASNLNKQALEFQSKIDIVNTAMKNLKLPEELQNNVRQFMFSNQSSLETQTELDEFLTLISNSHKSKVIKSQFSIVLEDNHFFKT